MACGDMIYRSTLPKSNELTITTPGVILALGTLSYLWVTPGVAPGFWDMLVIAFVERIFRPTYRKDDFVLGKKLGEGAFGTVYRVSLAKKGSSKSLLAPWRLLFAFVPPYQIAHGWVAFIFSLIFISGIAFIVTKLTDLISCVTGINAYVIAFTTLAS